MKDTRVFRSADIGSDHYLVCTTIKLRLKTKPREKKNTRVKYNTTRLKNEAILKTFTINLRNRLQVLEDEETGIEDNEEVERDSQVMEKAYTEVAEATLGRPRTNKKPWISEESWSLVDQREEINKKILGTCSERIKKQLKAKYAEKDRETKRSIKTDKKKWMENIASEAEEEGSTKSRTTRKQNKTIAVKDECDLTNRIEAIAVHEPTLGEVKEVIKGLQNGKAPGIDNITAKLLKADIEFSTKKVHKLLEKIWKNEKVPKNWKRGLIIKLAKKGNLKECKNSRGITLLSSSGKGTREDRH